MSPDIGQRTAHLHGANDRGIDLHGLFLQRYLAAGDSADIQEVVYEPRQLRNLAIDNAMRPLLRRIAGGPKSHEIERVANGGQWISQLVTQHREKLVHSAFAAFEHLNTSYFLLQRPIGSLELLRARRHACLKL